MYGHNSTIKRKLKPCKRCGQPSYIFSRGRCQQCSKIEDFKAIPEHSDNELDILINDFDILFSQYIRLKFADKHGNGKCFTCDTEAFWQNYRTDISYRGQICFLDLISTVKVLVPPIFAEYVEGFAYNHFFFPYYKV